MPDLKEVDKLIKDNGFSPFLFTIKDKQNIANDPELMENTNLTVESSESVLDKLVHAIQEFFHMYTCR